MRTDLENKMVHPERTQCRADTRVRVEPRRVRESDPHRIYAARLPVVTQVDTSGLLVIETYG